MQWKNENFGNLAIAPQGTHSFASRPLEQFAFIGFQRSYRQVIVRFLYRICPPVKGPHVVLHHSLLRRMPVQSQLSRLAPLNTYVKASMTSRYSARLGRHKKLLSKYCESSFIL
jgi:hypothetical protein